MTAVHSHILYGYRPQRVRHIEHAGAARVCPVAEFNPDTGLDVSGPTALKKSM